MNVYFSLFNALHIQFKLALIICNLWYDCNNRSIPSIRDG